MKVVSLKIREDILAKTEEMVKETHVSRNAYINQAIDFFNAVNRRRLLKKNLAIESALVAGNSLDMLSLMEEIDDESII
jgi:hypothetical protein